MFRSFVRRYVGKTDEAEAAARREEQNEEVSFPTNETRHVNEETEEVGGHSTTGRRTRRMVRNGNRDRDGNQGETPET